MATFFAVILFVILAVVSLFVLGVIFRIVGIIFKYGIKFVCEGLFVVLVIVVILVALGMV